MGSLHFFLLFWRAPCKRQLLHIERFGGGMDSLIQEATVKLLLCGEYQTSVEDFLTESLLLRRLISLKIKGQCDVDKNTWRESSKDCGSSGEGHLGKSRCALYLVGRVDKGDEPCIELCLCRAIEKEIFRSQGCWLVYRWGLESGEQIKLELQTVSNLRRPCLSL